MFKYGSNRIKGQIKMKNLKGTKFIILKYDNYLIFIMIFLIIIELNTKTILVKADENNEIFIIINKTLKREIINYKFNNDINEVIINEKNITNIQGVDNIIVNSEHELNNITIKFTNKLVSCSNMFNNLNNIIFIDLSKFDSSSVQNMKYMFNGCSSLISLNLSNFITSNVLYLEAMFFGCSSLISLDLSNFVTSNVNNLINVFKGCHH